MVALLVCVAGLVAYLIVMRVVLALVWRLGCWKNDRNIRKRRLAWIAQLRSYGAPGVGSYMLHPGNAGQTLWLDSMVEEQRVILDHFLNAGDTPDAL